MNEALLDRWKARDLFGTISETDRIQLEREAAAYNAFQDATKRGRKAEAILLWSEYARIHAQRPQAMVERLEKERGLR